MRDGQQGRMYRAMNRVGLCLRGGLDGVRSAQLPAAGCSLKAHVLG